MEEREKEGNQKERKQHIKETRDGKKEEKPCVK